MSKRFKYTKANVLKAMRLFQAEYGYAPNSQSGIIEHGDIANGTRTWLDVCNAFIRGAVIDVPKDVRMKEFVKSHKLRTQSIYTKNNIKEAMRLFYKEHGHAPERYSGMITKGKLADGTRTWENVYGAFKRGNIDGVPKNILMPELAEANGFKKRATYTKENTYEAISLYILKYGVIPQRNFDLIKNGILANNTRAWIDVYKAFYRGLVRDVDKNVSMSDFAQSIFDELEASGQLNHIENFDADLQPNEPKEFPVNVCVHSPVTSKDVFNVVAAQLANSERLVSKKVFDPTNINSFERHKGRKITNGLTETNPIVLLGYTWERLVEDISLGYVVDLPQDFDLARYASKIEDRLQAKNYRSPPAGEVLRWMKLAA